jgi:FkbM family methyltransferase
MSPTKVAIREFGRWLGLDIRFHRSADSPLYPLVRSLDHFGVNLVLDIGAGSGTFGRDLYSAGYRGEVVSFEPLDLSWRIIKKRSRPYAGWQVAPRMAIGETSGTVTLNVAGNHDSSSVLEMAHVHTEIAPHSAPKGTQEVPIRPLDAVAFDYHCSSKRTFLKIDVQGYESRVLNGADLTLKHALGVMIELSVVEVYSGQDLWKSILQRLEDCGFMLWGLRPGFSDVRRSGRMLQFDAVLFKHDREFDLPPEATPSRTLVSDASGLPPDS